MTPHLEARRLSAGYGGRAVIEDVSFSLAPGTTLAIVGPNAVGKSTLLRALVGAQAPLSGEVQLAGRPLAELSGRERARRIAFVPQSVRYDIDFTVREMVALGRTPRSETWGFESGRDGEIVREALQASELTGIEHRSFSALSGGERQRVLFARALAQEADVLLLDEPTAHLDLAHQLLLIEQVRAHAAKQGAAAVVLHDLSLALRLDQMLILDGGRVVALGAPHEVLTPQQLSATWRVDGALEQRGEGWGLAIRGRVSR